MTIRRGRRCSAAVAYLRPALRRKNLTLVSNALTKRIVFDGLTDMRRLLTDYGFQGHPLRKDYL